MTDSPAAHLAARLRTAMKDQALNGAGLADEVERLTGVRPSPTWVSRRTNEDGSRFQPLIRVSDDLYVLTAALGLDPLDLVEDAMRATMPAAAEFEGGPAAAHESESA